MPKRVDRNQTEIVQILRDMGVSVAVTSDLGQGFPDLVLGICNRNYLVEVKDGSKPPSKRVLTPDERKFFNSWKGQVDIISCVNDAINFVNKIRKGIG